MSIVRALNIKSDTTAVQFPTKAHDTKLRSHSDQRSRLHVRNGLASLANNESLYRKRFDRTWNSTCATQILNQILPSAEVPRSSGVKSVKIGGLDLREPRVIDRREKARDASAGTISQ